MNWIKDLYQSNTFFRGIVQAAEGGAITGLTVETVNGFDLSKHGLIRLGTAIGAGIAVAVRNFLSNRPNQPATIDGEKQPSPTK